MVEETLAVFIRDVGFPIAAFILMLMLYIHTTKVADKRQTDGDCRYEKLVNKFVESMETISREQTAALGKMTEKLDMHIKQKDEFIELIKDMKH